MFFLFRVVMSTTISW